MKFMMTLLALGFLFTCSTNDEWDSGGQKQQAMQEHSYQDRVEETKKQVPDETQILNQAQPF